MRHTRNPSPLRRAFTLIELMIVIVIIGILAGVVGFRFLGQAEQAKVDATNTQMQTIASVLKVYKVKYNTYPPRPPGLQVLLDTKQIDDLPTDAWGKDFDYYAPTANHEYELISAGPDGIFGNGDDLIIFPDSQ